MGCIQCRDSWDLDNTNGYSRYTCNNSWCGIVYALYFEKDQALPGFGLKDSAFASHLSAAKPAGIAFDPNA